MLFCKAKIKDTAIELCFDCQNRVTNEKGITQIDTKTKSISLPQVDQDSSKNSQKNQYLKCAINI
jgi:hypothetical protein